MQALKQCKYGNIERAKLQLLNLSPSERYALMEKRILANYCPNCDIPLNRQHTKMFKCSHCGFVSDGI